jgi:carboxypeptidase Taq
MTGHRAAYEALYDRARRVGALEKVDEALYWDEQVVMPSGGTPARSAQRAAIATARHRTLTDDRTGDLLDRLEPADLEGQRAALVREVARERRDATRVPEDLVERLQAALSDAQPAWREAKETDEFATFEPALERIVRLKREFADRFDHDSRFETLYAVGEFNEPYLPLSTVERVLSRLREESPRSSSRSASAPSTRRRCSRGRSPPTNSARSTATPSSTSATTGTTDGSTRRPTRSRTGRRTTPG